MGRPTLSIKEIPLSKELIWGVGQRMEALGIISQGLTRTPKLTIS